jgi:hypothetical protein
MSNFTPPFRTDGIYVRKTNPETDLINYTPPTKLGSIWKIAIGENNDPIYDLIRFVKEVDYDSNGNKSIGFSVDCICISGELLDLVDRYKGRKISGSNYINLSYIYDKVLFENNDRSVRFIGECIENLINFDIRHSNNKDVHQQTYRFIPWEI